MTPKPTKEAESLSELLSDLEERIRLRAYELYEQRGKEEGHDLDDWLQAEAELTKPKKTTTAA